MPISPRPGRLAPAAPPAGRPRRANATGFATPRTFAGWRTNRPRIALRSAARFAVLLLTAALGLPLPTRSQGSDAPRERPNIVFVFTDDHAAHAISAYGSKINRTPNIDRLAKEGMLFRNCFCTNSICAPSRAVILTGKHSHQNGVPTNDERFDGSQQTFPKLLQAAGYQTAMIGKWHLKSDPTGFDYYDVLRGQGTYYNPRLKRADGQRTVTGYTTDILTDLALEWLENGRDGERPFLLMLQHKAPHREWSPGPKYLTKYDDVEIPEPTTLFDDYAGRATPAREQEMTLAHHFQPARSEAGATRQPRRRSARGLERRLWPQERRIRTARPRRSRPGPVALPALHQGLPPLYRLGGRQPRSGASTGSTAPS